MPVQKTTVHGPVPHPYLPYAQTPYGRGQVPVHHAHHAHPDPATAHFYPAVSMSQSVNGRTLPAYGSRHINVAPGMHMPLEYETPWNPPSRSQGSAEMHNGMTGPTLHNPMMQGAGMYMHHPTAGGYHVAQMPGHDTGHMDPMVAMQYGGYVHGHMHVHAQ